MIEIRRLLQILLVLALPVLLSSPAAGGAGFEHRSDENQRCLECHARPGIVMVFQDSETLDAYLDPEQYGASVHGSLACTSCHTDFTAGKNPDRQFKNKQLYQVKTSHLCRRCHTDEQIGKRPVHAGLLRNERSGSPPVCASCHGSHSIIRVSGKGSFSNEEQYCMKCHARPVALALANGQERQLRVDPLLLRTSVHGKLSCSDCHFGFSSEEHPHRTFRTSRDFTLSASESCRRCHFDKYTKTLESIHYTLLSQGNLNAPVCIDCHGAHEIYRVGKDRTSSARRCQRCHAGLYETYSKSVHGNALFNEHNQDVPVCVDCHTAHTIQDPFSTDYRDRIPEMCSNCHARKEIVGKYGLSTDVVRSYLTDFHGITLGLYKLQRSEPGMPRKPIAVCTDCHGTHGIASTGGSEAVVKRNLLKRCQKCHPDANERFPDAWLSHYEPSMKRAPLVFIAATVYKVFIPLMIIGFILQILLHIWRYAVNR